MFLWFLLFIPVTCALILTILPPEKTLNRLTPLVPLSLFIILLAQASRIADGDSIQVNYLWVEALGLELKLVLDGLSYLFTLIITGIGSLIVLYTLGYFHKIYEVRRFLIYLFIFMFGMLGIVLAGNLLAMFVFWEVTTISSYLLIGFKHHTPYARVGARKALIITGGGGLALLGGIAMIGVMTNGDYDFQTLDSITKHRLFEPALILIILGAFTKSAQFPFHFWLPGAMEAPTPASSYLHSATMVKAGVYLLARLSSSFGSSDIWLYALTITGLFTFVYAAVMALRAVDLKAILAYTTVSWLGILIALIGLNTKESLKAAMVGIVAHALYKGALFLVVGSVDHQTGTRDIRRLGALAGKLPYTTTAATLALLSMAGIPPMIGFIAKETLKVAALENVPEELVRIFPVASVAGAALTVAVALIIALEVFFRQPRQQYDYHIEEASWTLWFGPLLLGLLSLGLPLALEIGIEPLIDPAVSATYGKAADVEIHLIPSLDDTAFQLSLLAIAIGVGLGSVGRPLRRVLQRVSLEPTRFYDRIFGSGEDDQSSWLYAGFHLVETHLQNGVLRHYLTYIFASFVVVVLGVTVQVLHVINLPALNFDDLTALETFIAILIMVAAIRTPLSRRRLEAVVWAGIAGSNIALLFVLFGAPDLAFTQLLIEVLSLIFLMLAFRLLPRFMQDTSRYTTVRTLRDIVIAAAVGITFTVVTLLVTANREAESIRYWFEENAHELGKGNNIVNVILVDFRGLDTLGETTVLVIAALGVLALISPMPLLDMLDKRFSDKARQALIRYTRESRDESVISSIYRNISNVLLVNLKDEEEEVDA